MKNKSLKVVIADPCHENWDSMSPTDQGRFCSSCSRPVMDFSGMSDLRLTEILQENKGQHMCGRFTEGQLNRSLMNAIPEQRSNHLRAVLLGATLTSIFGLESCKSDKAVVGKMFVIEAPVQHKRTLAEDHYITEQSSFLSKSKEALKINGMVTDADSGLGISDSEIELYSSTGIPVTTVKAKRSGAFKIDCGTEKDGAYLMVSSPGYMNYIVYLRDISVKDNFVIALTRGERMMKGEVMVIEN